MKLPGVMGEIDPEDENGQKLGYQDAVAREVLGIIKPAAVKSVPDLDKVEELKLLEYSVGEDMILKRRGERLTIKLAGIDFMVDRYLHDGKPTTYIAATAFLMQRMPELVRLAKKKVLVGMRADGQLAEQRMVKLRDRLITPEFIKGLSIRGQLALVEIREFPSVAGDLEELCRQVLDETIVVVNWMLSAAELGVKEISDQVGMVKI